MCGEVGRAGSGGSGRDVQIGAAELREPGGECAEEIRGGWLLGDGGSQDRTGLCLRRSTVPRGTEAEHLQDGGIQASDA